MFHNFERLKTKPCLCNVKITQIHFLVTKKNWSRKYAIFNLLSISKNIFVIVQSKFKPQLKGLFYMSLKDLSAYTVVLCITEVSRASAFVGINYDVWPNYLLKKSLRGRMNFRTYWTNCLRLKIQDAPRVWGRKITYSLKRMKKIVDTV